VKLPLQWAVMNNNNKSAYNNVIVVVVHNNQQSTLFLGAKLVGTISWKPAPVIYRRPTYCKESLKFSNDGIVIT
jgi:hypothetical protein